MNNPPEPYAVLGLKKDATHERVRARYKLLAMKTHPDRGGNKKAFQELNTAAETILNGGAAPDNKGADALSAIADRFIQIIKQSTQSPDTYDIVGKTRDGINADKTQIKSDIARHKEQIKLFDKLKNRMTSGNQPNVFETLVLQIIDASVKSTNALETTIEQYDLMLEILTDYKYKFDEPPPTVFATAGFTTTTTTAAGL